MAISEYFKKAELAQAAYANLPVGAIGEIGRVSLQDDAGMTLTQSQYFSNGWRVLDQYDGMVEEIYYDEFGLNQTFLKATGLSVTLFEDKSSGKQVVAIRGSNDPFDFYTDVIDIALLGTAEYQGQYEALSLKVQAWRDNGVLQPGFSVTGHSLGGFLAQALTAEYDSLISGQPKRGQILTSDRIEI